MINKYIELIIVYFNFILTKIKLINHQILII